MRLSLGRVLLALAGSAIPAPAPAQVAGPASLGEKTASVRDGLEALEARLDRAVDRVSLPHAARLLGRAESARAYRLPGYGVVLVLTPRALPGASGRVYFLQRGRSPRQRVRVETGGDPASGTVVVDLDEEGVETFERQVLVLQHETEAMRRAAEEEMERIVHDVRVRVAPPAPPPPAPAPAEPTPAEAPPPPPPWRNWIEASVPAEAREPGAVVADVRAALVQALSAPGELATGLAGDERVTVAVDFVQGGLFVASTRPYRTLLVSVRARDVAARARGAISADELRRRVEVNEY